jgi:hypothetical protein
LTYPQIPPICGEIIALKGATQNTAPPNDPAETVPKQAKVFIVNDSDPLCVLDAGVSVWRYTQN